MNAWAKERTFELPKNLEKYLAILSRRYKGQGNETLLKIVVNAKPEVDVGVDYDNWNGGQSGHRVRLQVPESLFHEVMEAKNDFAKALCKDLNALAEVPDEYFAEVVITLDEEPVAADWREKSGALLAAQPSLAKSSESDDGRLWGAGRPRIFLSHRAEQKKTATTVKEELGKLGAAAFVAHEDIEPTKEWQTEIERALGSMDVLVAILTTGFRESHWTNQEIGVAIGRGIPVISIRLGEDPAGFIGKHQALPGDLEHPNRMATALFARMLENLGLVKQILPALVERWEQSDSFSSSNQVMAVLKNLSTVPGELMARLEKAYKANKQLYGSGFVAREFPAFVARIKATEAKASEPMRNA
jgi:nucleoside 2-deoxyribosyltransferase